MAALTPEITSERTSINQSSNYTPTLTFATGTCVGISVFCLLILLTELISFASFRVFQGSKAGVLNKSYIYKDRKWANEYWSEFVRSYRNEYKSYIVWRRAPFSGKYINVDENGNRRTVNPDCTPGAYSIWMFGASILWGTGVSDEQTIPSLISKRYATTIGPVCVTNFGETGYVNTQEVIQLMLALKHESKAPQLVIFYDGAPDAFGPLQSDKPDVHGNFERIREQVEKARGRKGGFAYLRETNTGLLLTAFLNDLNLRQAVPRSAGTVGNFDAMALITVANYLGNMSVVEGLASNYGFRYVSIWSPTIFLGHKSLTAEENAIFRSYIKEIPGEAELFRKTYDALFAAKNVHLVNAEDTFDGAVDSLYLDLGHTGPAGDQLAADRIFQVLLQRGLLQNQ